MDEGTSTHATCATYSQQTEDAFESNFVELRNCCRTFPESLRTSKEVLEVCHPLGPTGLGNSKSSIAFLANGSLRHLFRNPIELQLLRLAGSTFCLTWTCMLDGQRICLVRSRHTFLSTTCQNKDNECHHAHVSGKDPLTSIFFSVVRAA